MKKHFWSIFFAYATEIALAGLIFTALLIIFGIDPVSKFVSDTASEFSKLAFVLFTASLTVWGLFFNFSKPDSAFGAWLNEKGADKVFHYAIATSIVFNFITSVLLIISSKVPSPKVSTATALFAILSIINLYSLISNAWSLIKLSHEFKRMEKSKSPTG